MKGLCIDQRLFGKLSLGKSDSPLLLLRNLINLDRLQIFIRARKLYYLISYATTQMCCCW